MIHVTTKCDEDYSPVEEKIVTFPGETDKW
jgi:hypothetical protein